jgi:hypothetical protein
MPEFGNLATWALGGIAYPGTPRSPTTRVSPVLRARVGTPRRACSVRRDHFGRLMRTTTSRSHSGSCVSASSSLDACADTITSDGNHPGNAVRVTRCAPEALCSSCRASRAPTSNRSARRTSGGQSRRSVCDQCTNRQCCLYTIGRRGIAFFSTCAFKSSIILSSLRVSHFSQ